MQKKVYPLHSISIDEAIQIQFKNVEAISSSFNGYDILSLGDLGVKQPENSPLQTIKAETAISKMFNVEAAALVTGSGTGAIRCGLTVLREESKKVLVHNAPIYPTTKVSIEQMSLEIIKADFNDINELIRTIKNNPKMEIAIVQYTRQKLDDSYSYEEVIKTIKTVNPNIRILTDDNYAVFKTGNIGTDFKADLSTFSTFKLQGPEGVGAIVGTKKYVDKIKKMNYSGGSQVQGWQAMEVLRGFVAAPVSLAIQADTINKTVNLIKNKKIKEIKDVYVVNAQSKVIIVKFNENIAKKVIRKASEYGMLPHPVGAESKYEITPLFYRASGTFRKNDPTAEETMLRINPNRAGSKLIVETLIKILEEI